MTPNTTKHRQIAFYAAINSGQRDFSGKSLEGLCLARLDLCRTSFKNANLKGADLTAAILREADLEGACLDKACLRDATLDNTKVEGAFFQGADFRGAFLGDLNFDWADLSGADFRGTRMATPRFDGSNLYKAKLLKSRGPRTQIRSLLAEGRLQAFAWNAFVMMDGQRVLRYGCETHSLSVWSRKVWGLCLRHLDPESVIAYRDDLRALIRFLRDLSTKQVLR